MTPELERNIHRLNAYLSETKEIVDRVSREELARFVEELVKAWKRGSTLFVVGNGGSADNAKHFAADLLNTTRDLENEFPHLEIPRVKAMDLTSNVARMTALINDEGLDKLFSEQIKNFWREGDIFIAFSVHGGKVEEKYGARSQNILAAAQFCRLNGGVVLSFTGFDGGTLRQISSVNINVPVYSTPHTEGLHAEIFHGIIFAALKLRIREETLQRNG